jgi:hypothetical protein
MKHPEPYKTITFSDPENDPDADATAAGDDQPIAEHDKKLLTPILYVRVHGPNKMLPLEAVVDSGASQSLFSCAVMEALGYTKADCEESDIQVGSGMTKQYLANEDSDVLIEIPSLGHSLRVRPAFVDGLEGGIMLLGRTDFFEQFLITFDQRASTFWLEPYNDSAVASATSVASAASDADAQ